MEHLTLVWAYHSVSGSTASGLRPPGTSFTASDPYFYYGSNAVKLVSVLGGPKLEAVEPETPTLEPV